MENEVKTSGIEENHLEKRKGDKYIWGVFVVLCILSIVETYSAFSREITSDGVFMPIIKHSIFLCMGAGIAYALQMIPYHKFIKFIPAYCIITFGLLVYVQFFGGTINGAKRALFIFGFTIQPGEMAKLGVILAMAFILAKNQRIEDVSNKGVALCGLVVVLFGAIIFRQGLTNTLLLMAISFSMIIVGGIKWVKLMILIGIYGVFIAGYIGYKEVSETVEEESTLVAPDGKLKSREGTWENRIKSFFDTVPLYKRELTERNSQEMYARMAQAHGGVFGVMPGFSRESSRLPLAFSDYIYSIIVEEMGLIGGLAVLLIYLSLMIRAGVIARKCVRAFPAFLVTGMAVLIVYQALFHIAINVGAFPVSGQPLPLISDGGTSILIMSVAFGIMLSVSRTAVRVDDKTKEIKEELKNLPENIQGENQGKIN